MCNEDGTIWIVFNGEIYNFLELRKNLEAKGHTFRSQTDTETIIHAYEMGWHEMIIPVANRDHIAGTSERDKIDVAILDTFDWYSPKYDKPQSEQKVMKILASLAYENITRTYVGAIQGARR